MRHGSNDCGANSASPFCISGGTDDERDSLEGGWRLLVAKAALAATVGEPLSLLVEGE
jgi:hypothetical protein